VHGKLNFFFYDYAVNINGKFRNKRMSTQLKGSVIKVKRGRVNVRVKVKDVKVKGVKSKVRRTKTKKSTMEVKLDIYQIALRNHTWINSVYYFWKWVCIVEEHSDSLVERLEFRELKKKWEGKTSINDIGFEAYMYNDDKMVRYRGLCKR